MRIFLYFLQEEHRQIRRSGDLEAEQAVRVMVAEQLVQDMGTSGYLSGTGSPLHDRAYL